MCFTLDAKNMESMASTFLVNNAKVCSTAEITASGSQSSGHFKLYT